MTESKHPKPGSQSTERGVSTQSENEKSALPVRETPTSLRSAPAYARRIPSVAPKGSGFGRAWSWAVLALIALIAGGVVWLSLIPEEEEQPAQVTLEPEEVTAPPAEVMEAPPETATPPVEADMEPARPAVPGTYTVERGDTLAKIATKLYGDPRKWTEIAKANPDLNPNRLKVGQVIKLPDLPARQE